MANKEFGAKDTLLQLQDWVRRDFEDWYDSATPIISAVERKVYKDLTTFSEQLHSHQLVKLSVRRKAKESFVNKIWSKLHGRRDPQLRERFGRTKIGPEDLVQDLVGARFIMYAGRDQLLPLGFLSFWQELRVEELGIYSIFPEDSPFFPRELYEQMKGLSANVVAGVQQKDSGYESIHAIARIDKDYARVRQSVASSNGRRRLSNLTTTDQLDAIMQLSDREWDGLRNLQNLTSKKASVIEEIERRISVAEQSENELLDRISFEVQIRTALQDNWAQIEHQVRYGQEKAAGATGSPFARSATSKELLNQAFKAQTILTSALEQSQRLIPMIVGYDSDQLEIKSLTLGKRGTFFDDPDIADVLNRTNDLNTRLEKQLERGQQDDDILEKLLGEINQLSTDSGTDFRLFKIDEKPEYWGRRRYILLMLGYVLLKGNKKQRVCVVSWFKAGTKNSRMPQDPYWAATYIYDHIRFVDTHFRKNSRKYENYFSDPLLAYRVAGLAVQRGEFHKAMHELDTAIQLGFIEKFHETDPNNLVILNHARFERRCAQYHWWTYLSNRVENADELFAAIERARNVLEMKDTDIIPYDIEGFSPAQRTDVLRHEQRSAAMSFLLYSFHRFILRREGIPNWSGFSDARQSIDAHLQRLFGPSTPLLLSNSVDRNDRPHFKGEKRLIDGLLAADAKEFVDALQHVRQAIRDFEESPGKTDLPGDRVALAREIEELISAQYQG